MRLGVLTGFVLLLICEGCEHPIGIKHVNRRFSSEEKPKIDKENFKKEILKLLGLKKRPNPPKMLTEEVLRTKNVSQQHRHNYQAELHDTFLFPSDMATNMGVSSELTVMLKFPTKTLQSIQNLISAHLWLYQSLSTAAMVTVYTEIEGRRSKICTLLQTEQMHRTSSKWQRYEVTDFLRSEMGSSGLTLLIDCYGCDNNSIGTTDDFGPFIVVTGEHRPLSQRDKRAIKCLKHYKNHCCVEEFQVSFEDIGWHDWIIAPRRLDVNYCRGNCIKSGDIDRLRYTHTRILRALGEKSGVQICCSASKLVGADMIYLDSQGDTVKKYIKDMRVVECQCG